MSRYLPRIVARRTLLVRVSSSSSASSSLSNSAKARIRAASGRSLVHARHRLARSVRRPPACAERSLKVVNGSRLLSAQLPTFAHVDLDERDHVRPALADHHRLAHVAG